MVVTMEKVAARLRASPLFNATWYAATYPDVALSGMDPARHFLLVGDPLGRDPGPRFVTALWRDLSPGAARASVPAVLHFEAARRRDRSVMLPSRNNVLFLAGLLDRAGDHAGAIALAERHLPSDLAHTATTLHANAALARGDEATWLGHLNAYLARSKLAPVGLEGEGPLLDRLTSAGPLHARADGPLVSVLMPAWNAAGTIMAAARSILRQTWRRLELIIVDDASTDGTAAAMQELAAADARVRIVRNPINSGPYVAKNIALRHTRGAWITGHDADDWAHPQRIERHMDAVLGHGRARGETLHASLTHMIRLKPDGSFSFLDKLGAASPDGVARRAPISCLFEASFLHTRLGHWDTVRFGADSEMIGRVTALLGSRFATLDQPSMLCLDVPTSLSNHARHGIHKVRGASPVRAVYHEAWRAWHKTLSPDGDAYLAFPQRARRFEAPVEMRALITPETLALASS